MIQDWLLLALVGGVAFVDRTAAVQSMVSRPLVTGAVAGWILGRPEAGLLVGALLEFFWLYELPVGAAVPPDEAGAGLAAAVVAASMPDAADLWARLGAGGMAGLAAGHVGGRIDVAVRRWNRDLAARARAALAAGKEPGLGRLVLVGGARFWAAGTASGLALVGAGLWLAPRVPEPAFRGLGLLGMTLVVLAASVCLGRLATRRAKGWFLAGALLGAGAGKGAWPWRG